jgi:hypothetical protein
VAVVKGNDSRQTAHSRVDPVRRVTALDVQSQLPAQEEVFGAQGLGRTKQEH